MSKFRNCSFSSPWIIRVGMHSAVHKRSASISLHKYIHLTHIRKMKLIDAQLRFRVPLKMSHPWMRVSSVASVLSLPLPQVLLLCLPRTLSTMHRTNLSSPPYPPRSSPICPLSNVLKPSESLAWNPISRYLFPHPAYSIYPISSVHVRSSSQVCPML